MDSRRRPCVEKRKEKHGGSCRKARANRRARLPKLPWLPLFFGTKSNTWHLPRHTQLHASLNPTLLYTGPTGLIFIMDQDYKARKEAFVSNLSGGDINEINAVALVASVC